MPSPSRVTLAIIALPCAMLTGCRPAGPSGPATPAPGVSAVAGSTGAAASRSPGPLGERAMATPMADPASLVDATIPHVDGQAAALIDDLAGAVRMNPGDGQSWLSLCMAIYFGNVVSPADRCFRQAALRLSTDGRPEYFLGRIAEQSGDPRTALELYRDAIRLAPDQPFLHWRAGFAALALDELDAAQAAFEAGLREDPGLVAANAGLARVALQRDDLPAAAAALEGVSGGNPDESAALATLLATVYQRLGRTEEAAALRARAGEPSAGTEPWSDPWQQQVGAYAGGFGAEMQRSAALMESGQAEGAIASLQELLESHPQRDEIHLRLGTAYGMEGDYPRAREAFEKVVDGASARGYALEGLARTYLLEAQTARPEDRDALLAQALRHAEAAIADPQSPPGAHGLRGDVLQLRGDRDGALAAYLDAAAAEPRQARWRAAVARMRLLKGDWADAAREARQATALDPALHGPWAVLAFAAARMGDAPTAAAALAEARRLAPDDPQVQAAAAEVDALRAAP